MTSNNQPGSESTRLSKPRPGCDGSSSRIICEPIAATVAVRLGSISVSPALTWTCVCTEARPRVTFMSDGTSERISTVCTFGAKAAWAVVNRYSPNGRSCAVAWPPESAVKLRRIWLASLTNSMAAAAAPADPVDNVRVDPFAGECVAWCAEGTIFPVEKSNRECLPSSRAPARPNRKAFVVPQLQFLISSCDVARHKRISVCELHL